MKKICALGLVIIAFSSSAGIVRSDLNLLNSAPDWETDRAADPHWELAWHGRVASYGDPDSQFFMGQVYERGELVPKNIGTAIQFYRKAAEQGHLESCRKLAELLPDQAEDWYKLAAEQNDPQAQLHLAHLYEQTGKTDEAIIWMERAMRLLFPEAEDLTAVSPDLKRLKESL